MLHFLICHRLSVGSATVPCRYLHIALWYAPACFVHPRKSKLGRRIASVGGEAIPLYRLDIILRHALALGIHDPDNALSETLPESASARNNR